MMVIKSEERNDNHTAILINGEWIPVSDMERAEYIGREQGWDIYEIEVADSCPYAKFYRSVSGATEDVSISFGEETIGFESWHEAYKWGEEYAPELIIVTRHSATVEWLKREVPELDSVKVIENATPAEVQGKVVYGNLPPKLACQALKIVAIEFTGTPPRGSEYTIDDMDEQDANLVEYIITKL